MEIKEYRSFNQVEIVEFIKSVGWVNMWNSKICLKRHTKTL